MLYPSSGLVQITALLTPRVQLLQPVPQLMNSLPRTIAFYSPVSVHFLLIKLLSALHSKQLVSEVQEMQLAEHYRQFNPDG